MKLNTKNFGLGVAIVVAFLWSFYSFSNLFLDIVIITLVDGTIYGNLSDFKWADFADQYLAQVIGITLITGILGWLVAEIYNELEDLFSLRLK